MEQKRLNYLDMAKGIGIFLVVLGHIEYIQEGTMKWIFSFHMPLFFVVGGILFRLKEEEKRLPGVTLSRKVRGILTPYLSFSLVMLTMSMLDLVLKGPAQVTGVRLLRELVDSLTGYGVHILWFLPAYFLAMTGFYLVMRYLKGWKRGIVILILVLESLFLTQKLGLREYASMELSIWGFAGMNLLIVLLRSFLALPFVLLGWYLGGTFSGGDAKKRRLPEWIIALLLVDSGFRFSQQLPIFDLHYLYVEPLHYLSAACTCVGLILLLRLLPVSRALSYLGRNSLIIMCTHASFFVVYYISLGMFFIKKFIPMPQPAFNVGVAVLVCIAEVPIIWFFNRYLKHLLGRTT